MSQKSKEKKFVKDIEHFDVPTRDSRIRSYVESMLSRFSEKLSLSKENAKTPDELTHFESLFEEPSYSQMVDAGVRVVKGAVTPRSPSIWEHIQSMTQRFNKKAQVVSAENPKSAAASDRDKEGNEASSSAPPHEEIEPS